VTQPEPGERHFGDLRILTGGENAETSLPIDGPGLIFQSTRPPYACDQIHTTNPDGSELEQITFPERFDGFPMWAPDGKTFVRLLLQSLRPGAPRDQRLRDHLDGLRPGNPPARAPASLPAPERLQCRAMELWQYGLLALVGFGAGIINVLAGGGSFFTMPLMILMGMSPATANGTNRIALAAQNAMAVSEFRRRGFSDFRLSFTLALCTLPGAILGAMAAVRFDPLWFKRILAVFMIALLPVVLGGSRKARARCPRRGRLLAHLGAVGIGFYGGVIQAGTGPILIVLLVTTLGLDLVRVNMHKVFIIGFYMLPSLAIFVLNGNVDWAAGALLAVGNTAGAAMGTHLAVEGGERLIRVFVAAAVVVMALKLLLSS